MSNEVKECSSRTWFNQASLTSSVPWPRVPPGLTSVWLVSCKLSFDQKQLDGLDPSSKVTSATYWPAKSLVALTQVCPTMAITRCWCPVKSIIMPGILAAPALRFSPTKLQGVQNYPNPCLNHRDKPRLRRPPEGLICLAWPLDRHRGRPAFIMRWQSQWEYTLLSPQ